MSFQAENVKSSEADSAGVIASIRDREPELQRNRTAVDWTLFADGALRIARGSKRPVGDNWQKLNEQKTIKERLSTNEITEWLVKGNGIGLLGAVFPALDIDIKDNRLQPIAEEAKRLSREHFGDAPVRYRENTPSCAILLRGGADLPDKVVGAYDITVDGKQIGFKIEMRTGPNQTVFSGIHPDSKRPYLMDRGGFGPADLPAVTKDKWDAFNEAFKAYVESIGGCVHVEAVAHGGKKRPISDPALHAPSEAMARAFVDHLEKTLPEDPINFETAHAASGVGCALPAVIYEWARYSMHLFQQ